MHRLPRRRRSRGAASRGVAWAVTGIALSLLAGCGCNRLPPQPLIQVEDSAPSWSPDGEWIAYVHFNPDVRNTVEPSGLYVVDAAGTTKRLILGGFVYGNLPRSVDWSPDSQWLVYNDASGLHLITATGDSLHTIYSGGSFPSWSPLGSPIAFSTIDRVWLINPDGTGLSSVELGDPGGTGDPDWSPDGTRLVILHAPAGTTGEEVYVVRADGSDLRRLTTDDHEDRSPAWSPQGDLIAWNRWPRDPRGRIHHELWVMDTLGKSRRKLISAVAAPSWSPDGQRLVFSYQTTGAIRLFVINLDGTGLRQLTR